MSELASEFTVSVDQVHDYEFLVKFDNPELPVLTMDEPPPLGQDCGPNPSRVLAAAIAKCLCASLLFCTKRARVELGPIHADAKVQIVRNRNKRLRVGKVEVVIDPHLPETEKDKAARCLEIFEDFCIVTQSVREGIDIMVSVKEPA